VLEKPKKREVGTTIQFDPTMGIWGKTQGTESGRSVVSLSVLIYLHDLMMWKLNARIFIFTLTRTWLGCEMCEMASNQGIDVFGRERLFWSIVLAGPQAHLIRGWFKWEVLVRRHGQAPGYAWRGFQSDFQA
jgi:hypothetical protein